MCPNSNTIKVRPLTSSVIINHCENNEFTLPKYGTTTELDTFKIFLRLSTNYVMVNNVQNLNTVTHCPETLLRIEILSGEEYALDE